MWDSSAAFRVILSGGPKDLSEESNSNGNASSPGLDSSPGFRRGQNDIKRRVTA